MPYIKKAEWDEIQKKLEDSDRVFAMLDESNNRIAELEESNRVLSKEIADRDLTDTAGDFHEESDRRIAELTQNNERVAQSLKESKPTAAVAVTSPAQRGKVYPEIVLPAFGTPRAIPMTPDELQAVCEDKDSCLGPFLNLYNNTQIIESPQPMGTFLDTIYSMCKLDLTGNDGVTFYKMYKRNDWSESQANDEFFGKVRFEFLKMVGCFVLSHSVNRDVYGDNDLGEYDDADAVAAELIAYFDGLALEMTGLKWNEAYLEMWK